MADGTVDTKEIVRSLAKPIPANQQRPEWQKAQELSDRYGQSKESDPLAALKPEVEQQSFSINVDAELDRRIKDPNRLTDAQDVAGVIQTIMEGDLAKMAPQELAVITENLALEILGSRTAFKVLLNPNGTVTPEAASAIRSLLEDPRCQKEIQDKFSKLLDPNEQVGAGIARFTQELDIQKKALQDKLDAQSPDIRGKKRPSVKKELNEYKESQGGAGRTKGDRIKQLEGDEATDRKIIDDYKKDLELAIRRGNTTLTGTRRKEQEVDQKVQNGDQLAQGEDAIAEYLEARGRVGELDTLKATKDALEARLAEIDEIDDLTAKRDDAEKKHETAAQRQEETVMAQLRDVLGQSVGSVLDTEVEGRVEFIRKQLEEDTKKAGSEDEKRILEQMRKDWELPVYKNGRESSEIDKFMVNSDFGMLVSNGENGATLIVQKLLMSDLLNRIDPTTNNRYQQGVGGYNEEITRIEKLLDNKDFMDKMRPRVAKDLTTRYLLRGGKMRKDEIRLFRETSWGQSLVKDSIESNKELMKQINQAWGEKALTVGWWDRLKRMSDGNLLKLLLMLLLAGGLIPIGMKALLSTDQRTI